MRSLSIHRLATCLLVAVALLYVDVSMAVQWRLSSDRQALLLSKTFRFVKTLPDSPKILILTSENDRSMALALQKSFARLEWSTPIASLNDFASQARGVSVIYILASAVPQDVREYCARNGILSVSGVSGLVDRGEATLGLGVKEDMRPKIIVNMKRAQVEGQVFSSALLRLATVIR
jgi:hypothetical protein